MTCCFEISATEDAKVKELKTMLTIPKTHTTACPISYALEALQSIGIEEMGKFFGNLPADPYLAGNYRFRRFSRFRVVDDRLVQMPHGYLFQSKDYNPLLGDVNREYEELDPELIALQDFQTIVLEFFEFANCVQRSTRLAFIRFERLRPLMRLVIQRLRGFIEMVSIWWGYSPFAVTILVEQRLICTSRNRIERQYSRR